MLNKMKRPMFLLVLLLVVSMATGCFSFLGDSGPYKIGVEYDVTEGIVTLDGEQIESGFEKEFKTRDVIQFKAIPVPGMFFSHWEGVPSVLRDADPLTITVHNHWNFKAVFNNVPPGPVLEESFEDGIGGDWSFANASGEISSDIKRTGNNSAKITVSGGSEYNQFRVDLAGKVTPGNTYTISAWIYHESDEPIPFNIVSVIKYEWIKGNVEIPKGVWTEISGEYTVPNPDVSIYLEAKEMANAVYYVDDVRIEFYVPEEE